MRSPPFTTTVQNWTPEQRIARAEAAIKHLTREVDAALQRHATNQFVLFDKEFAAKIPDTEGAFAFSALQYDLASFEVIRLLSLWERAADNSHSIPTVLVLINDEAVLSAIEDSVVDYFRSLCPSQLETATDPDEMALIEKVTKQLQLAQSEDMADRARANCQAAIKKAESLAKHDVIKHLQNLRDHRAHLLEQTRRESKQVIPLPKYGDIGIVLDKSVEIVELLYLSVNGVSYSLGEEVRSLCKTRARKLWGEMQFSDTS